MKFTKLLDKRLLVVLLLLFSGVALLLNIRSRQEVRRKAAGPPQNVSLQIGTSVTNPAVGDTFPVDVTMAYTGTTGSTNVYGVDVKLVFPQAKLEVASIDRGTGLGDGCVSGSTSPVVLAPVMSETDCNFKDTEVGGVIPAANGSGVLEFGVVPFDWNAASTTTYQPAPINLVSGASGVKNVARVTFRVKAGATGTANVKLDGTGASTVDTNVAGLSSTNEVGDILASINPAVGIDVTIGSGVTPTVPVSPTATLTPVPGSCAAGVLTLADMNNDNNVGGYEYGVVVNNFNCSQSAGGTGCAAEVLTLADMNNDNNVGGYEYGVVVNNFNCGL